MKTSTILPATLGIRMHSGWGVLVAVSGNANSLEVITRKRIVAMDPTIPGAKQPYHHAATLESRQLGFSDSESYLANCAAISERMASAAVAEVVRELEGRHYRIVGSAVLLAAGRPLPSLVKILASHPLIHTAEGEFFRNAVRKACEILKIAVTTIRERELDAQAKTTFGKAASQVQHRISTLGISIGPPWTKDHKTAALAAANDFGMPLVNFSTSSQNRLLKQSIIRPMIKHNIHVVRSVSFALIVLMASSAALLSRGDVPAESAPPTFYRDVLPILQQHCQSCHRSGEIGPMSLVSFAETRPWAAAISEAARSHSMPPWFADPCCGHFADDPSLMPRQIATLSAWADASAPAGDPKDAPASPRWTEGWNIPQPDAVLQIPTPVVIPAEGDVEYTYEIVPTNFAADKWVQMSEVRPSSRAHVHHAVVYIRPPESDWLRGAPVGAPFTASSLRDESLRHQAHETKSDMLLVYAPGSAPDHWPDGMAKSVPAHSDLVFQMHYTTNGHAASDQSSIGLVFSKKPPAQRVITLQLANDHHPIPIPPNTDNYRVEVHGTLPNDCTLLSFFPHMHLRGKRFEYNIVHSDKTIETLLRVNYDFYWQLSYRLAEPRFLKAGTDLQAIAWYDNSRRNRHNPDPDRPVSWGDQTYNEMMVGFFDIAVPAQIDKFQFFVRH